MNTNRKTDIKSEMSETISEINSFKEFQDGWDGPDSFGPTDESIENAIRFLKFWNASVEKLQPELEYDGAVALQIYDSEGYTKGGINFYGNNKAFYAIVSRKEKIAAKCFNPKSESEVRQSIVEIVSALKKT